MQALATATDDDDPIAFEFFDAVSKLARIHETAFAQFLELQAQWQGVEIVLSHVCSSLCVWVMGKKELPLG